jgi:hypothetical protein
MSLTFIHDRLSITITAYFLIMGIWGLFRFFRKQGVDSSYWGALIIAEVLTLIQGGLGAFLWFVGLRPDRGGFHVLYGIVAVISIPAVYAFTKGTDDRRTQLVYATVMLFAWGIALRAIATGATP